VKELLYNFTEYLENNNYSKYTVNLYTDTILMFLGYIDKELKTKLEVHEIKAAHIKAFLEAKEEEGLGQKTINKYITILKKFFEYLWDLEKIHTDPTIRIKTYKVKDTKKLKFDYQNLLEIYPKVLANPNYTDKRVSIFILAMKGLRYCDFAFQKSQVIIESDHIILDLGTRIVTLEGREAEIFSCYYHESLLNGSDYVFCSKRLEDEQWDRMSQTRIRYDLRLIAADYQFPYLNLTDYRYLYISYLRLSLKKSVDEIAAIMGIEKKVVTQILQRTVESDERTA
jgi:site-specific recombinase XerD